MKFSTFLFKALLHTFVWFELLYGVLMPAKGSENMAVFVIGMVSAMGVVMMLLDGGLKSIDVPGSFFGRAIFQLFQLSSLLLSVALIEHGHFLAAIALTIAMFLRATAYRTVRRAEREVKAMLKQYAKAQKEQRDAEKSSANVTYVDPSAGFEQKTTTLELKVPPRDPSFDHPFSAAATSA